MTCVKKPESLAPESSAAACPPQWPATDAGVLPQRVEKSGDERPSGLEAAQRQSQNGFFFGRSPVRKHGVLYFDGKAERAGVPVKAVMFDLDGTLIDTREIFCDIINIVFKKLNFPGVGREALAEAAANGEFNWDLVLPKELKVPKEEVLLQVKTIIEEISPPLFRQRTKLISGAAEILRSLHEAGSTLGVVTSSRKRHVDMKMQCLEESGVAGLFEAIITADDVQMKKPSPEPLYECAGRLGVRHGECVYVGDMRVDIKAGKSAGMKTVGVLTGFDDRDHLEKEHPDVIIESVASLKGCFTQEDY
jgi:HAD superfamily hydrolase (TIGR01662 family)